MLEKSSLVVFNAMCSSWYKAVQFATGVPVLVFWFFVGMLVETRWCFVCLWMWASWFPLRGLAAFGFANVLVFKPLLHCCMALFGSSPWLPWFLLWGEEKEEKECLYSTAPFYLLDICHSFMCVQDYFWLVAEALNDRVDSLLTLTV